MTDEDTVDISMTPQDVSSRYIHPPEEFLEEIDPGLRGHVVKKSNGNMRVSQEEHMNFLMRSITEAEASDKNADEIKAHEAFVLAAERFAEEAQSNLRKPKFIEEYLENEPEREDTVAWWKWRLANFVEGLPFQLMIIGCIVVNAAILALNADDVIDEDGKVSHGLHITFAIIFNFEIFFKLAAYGLVLFMEDHYNRQRIA